MKLLDTNAISHILKTDLRARDTYYVAPDIREESEITEIVYGKRLSSNVKDVGLHPQFDMVRYVRHYKDMLNRYGDRSFYNMTGFGDISILAVLASIKDAGIERVPSLFAFADMEPTVTVITEDRPLKQKIEREFSLVKGQFCVVVLDNSAII